MMSKLSFEASFKSFKKAQAQEDLDTPRVRNLIKSVKKKQRTTHKTHFKPPDLFENPRFNSQASQS